ncbi:MAG: hypothetical protein WB709_02130 [Solirubrobacteraceae bacterium]
MYEKSRAAFVGLLVLVLSVVSFSTSAQAYEGATWSIGETELAENHVIKTKGVSGITLENKGLYIVNCNLTGESKIGLYGKGEITTALPKECKNSLGCTGTITVKAVHLPWHTQLEEPTETSVRNLLSSSGAGLPGWSLECTTAKIKDECTGETTAGLENVTGGTDLTFDAKSAALKCTHGGAGAGVIKGTVLYENTTEQVRGDERVDNLTGALVALGPTQPLNFGGTTSQVVILRNRAAIRRVYLNGGMDTPGEINPNPLNNFSIGPRPAEPCGIALAGGAECQIVINSQTLVSTGEYVFRYGPVGSPLTNRFQVVSP